MRFKKYKLVLLLADIVIVSIAIIIAYMLKQHHLEAIGARFIKLEPSILSPFVLLVISLVVMFRNLNLYRMQALFDSYYQIVVLVKSLIVSYGILITTLFFLKDPLLDQRGIIIPSFIILFILMPLYRIVLLKYTFRFALKNKIMGEKVILIGAGSKGQEIAKAIVNNQYSYFTPIGFMDDQEEIGRIFENVAVLGRIDSIQKYSDKFDEILITLTDVSYNELQEIINVCRKIKKPIHVISDLFRIIPEKLEVEKFDGISTFQIPAVEEFKEYTYVITKRVLDYTVALLLTLLLLPIWIVIAILIKIDSEGPILFETKVIGYREKSFVWYKFRSMYHKSDDSVHKKLIKEIAQGLRGGEKLKNDTRITPIGKWLRKFSIDEFPQLLNVLKGQMSLVGPRPVLPYEYELLDNWQKERFSVLPGMTGLWQVRGRNNVNFADQHVLDLFYVRNRSILLDIQLLINTIGVVISGRTGV